jgi:hypothetical protein
MKKNLRARDKTLSVWALFLLSALSLMVTSCTSPFPTPFENIVAGEKLRPFAVVCNPPEAAPGDTVSVSLYYYAPPSETPSIHWVAALDYGIELTNGSTYERNTVNLDSMMLPGSTAEHFTFRIPDSVLVHSTQIAVLLTNPNLQPYVNPFNLTAHTIDSTLRALAQAGGPVPALWQAAADNFSTKIKLRAQMRSSIALDVTMPLRVRYTCKLNPANANKNPVIHWMGVIRVPEGSPTDRDSIYLHPYELQYLYRATGTDSLRDTIVVDSGYNYFFAADSGIYGTDTAYQKFVSYSTNNLTATPDTENLRNTWFYSNLDFQSGMIMDSLLLFGETRSALGRMYPPVDTAMHRFQMWLVRRDQRGSDPGATPGEAFATATGYFLYTPAYVRHMVRNGGGGIFGG